MAEEKIHAEGAQPEGGEGFMPDDARVAPRAPRGQEEAKPLVATSMLGGKAAMAIAGVIAVIAVAAVVAFGAGFSSHDAAHSQQSESSSAANIALQEQPSDEEAASNEAAEKVDASEKTAEEKTDEASSENAETTSSSGESASSPKEPERPVVQKPETITVHVYIDSSRAPGYPSCMASTDVTIPAGSSVYDALRATGVSIGGGSTYVRSINGLSEMLPGYERGSGWMYSVDGDFPSAACGRYKLSGGEDICWFYTLDLGNDL